jgi:hypothetical protein
MLAKVPDALGSSKMMNGIAYLLIGIQRQLVMHLRRRQSRLRSD